MTFEVGDTVEWSWASGKGTGEIVERFEETVCRTIKGTDVTRHATPDEPAFLISQDDGDEVLKLSTEISKK